MNNSILNSNILIGTNIDSSAYIEEISFNDMITYFRFVSDILDLPDYEEIVNMTEEERQYFIKAYKRDKKIDSILNEDR